MLDTAGPQAGLQGEDSPPAPEGTEWKGIFKLLEHSFLTRRRFSSSARRNRMERYFYAPGTLFPYKEKILLQYSRRNRMVRNFYAPRTLFSSKEKILLQRQKEQNGKVFLHS